MDEQNWLRDPAASENLSSCYHENRKQCWAVIYALLHKEESKLQEEIKKKYEAKIPPKYAKKLINVQEDFVRWAMSGCDHGGCGNER